MSSAGIEKATAPLASTNGRSAACASARASRHSIAEGLARATASISGFGSRPTTEPRARRAPERSAGRNVGGRGHGVRIGRTMRRRHDRASATHDRASVVDVLSEVLGSIRLHASMLILVEARAPWLSWAPPERYEAGDVLVVPHGDAYFLADPPEARATCGTQEAVRFFRRMAAGEPPRRSTKAAVEGARASSAASSAASCGRSTRCSPRCPASCMCALRAPAVSGCVTSSISRPSSCTAARPARSALAERFLRRPADRIPATVPHAARPAVGSAPAHWRVGRT